MQKGILSSRWLRCALLLLLILIVTGSECGGPPGYTVPDRSQRGYDGGVLFQRGDPRTEAQVILDGTIEGAKVDYYVPKNQPFAWIPDPKKSNELTIMRPKDNTRRSTVTVAGDYTTKDGKSHHIETHVPLWNDWAN